MSLNEEVSVKFWKLFTSGSGSMNLLKDSLSLQDRAFFHNLAHVSEKLIGSS